MMSLTVHALSAQRSDNFIGSVFVHLQHARREVESGRQRGVLIKVGRFNHRLISIGEGQR